MDGNYQMNNLFKAWLDERISGIENENANYNDHVDQFFSKHDWGNIYDDCISLLVEATDYLLKKEVHDCVIALIIPLVQRNKVWVDYDIDLALDIPNFVFDKGNQPPSLYICKKRAIFVRYGQTESYIRPLKKNPKLTKYNSESVYRCERDVRDIEEDFPFVRSIDIRCYI